MIKVWEHFKKVVGREALLPIVQSGKLSPRSKIEARPPFKIPTVVNGDGYVVGLVDWADKVTTEGQYSVWSRRYGLGIRCGHELPTGGYLVGVDVDIENEPTQQRIYKALCNLLDVNSLPYRHRGNERRLYAIAVSELPRKVVLATRRGNIDILGQGQQFIAAGGHPSGEDYKWTRLPRKLRVVDFDELIECLSDVARITKRSDDRAATTFEQSDDEDMQRAEELFADVIEWLDNNADRIEGARYYFKTLDDSEYTSPSHDGDFVVMRPGANGYALPNVKMIHASDMDAAGSSEQDKWTYFCKMFDCTEFRRTYVKCLRAFNKRERKSVKARREDFEMLEEPEEATPSNIILADDRPVKGVKMDMDEMKDSERAKILRLHYGKVKRDSETKQIHVFNGAVWEHRPEDKLAFDMTRIYEESDQAADMREIGGAVKMLATAAAPMRAEPANLIGFMNGVYDMRHAEFREYAPDDYVRTHNGIMWTTPKRREMVEKHAKHFTKWLMWAADDDYQKAKRIMAAMFMILTRRYDWQLFIELTGVGGSGKSIFAEVANMLVGSHNVGAAGVDMLNSDVARVALVGKPLITLSEEGGNVKRATGAIKKVTGGDLLSFNPKFLPGFTARLNAVLLFTNNVPMRFPEDNGGIARRRVLFHFAKQVPVEKRDAELASKIKEELPVIVRHLFAMFPDAKDARLLLQEQMESEEAKQIIQDSDPMAVFVSLLEFTRVPSTSVVWCAKVGQTPIMQRHLYDTYKAFCELSGVRVPLLLQDFKTSIKHAMRDQGVRYCYRYSHGSYFLNVRFTEGAACYFRPDDFEDDDE